MKNTQEINRTEGEKITMEKELEREMMAIKKDLEKQDDEVIDEFLNDALDLTLHVSSDKKQLLGFDIAITMGGPFITLEYTRNRCELVGAWGGARLVMDVDNAVCDAIMERLEGLNN